MLWMIGKREMQRDPDGDIGGEISGGTSAGGLNEDGGPIGREVRIGGSGKVKTWRERMRQG